MAEEATALPLAIEIAPTEEPARWLDDPGLHPGYEWVATAPAVFSSR
jgi:hypothetical protein